MGIRAPTLHLIDVTKEFFEQNPSRMAEESMSVLQILQYIIPLDLTPISKHWLFDVVCCVFEERNVTVRWPYIFGIDDSSYYLVIEVKILAQNFLDYKFEGFPLLFKPVIIIRSKSTNLISLSIVFLDYRP